MASLPECSPSCDEAGEQPDNRGVVCSDAPSLSLAAGGPIGLNTTAFNGLHVHTCAEEGRGSGIFASSPIAAGDQAFVEAPTLSIQYRYSKRNCRCCSNCFRGLGNLEEALNRVLEIEGTRSLERDFPDAVDLVRELSEEVDTSEEVPCPKGCGASFCSSKCLEIASRFTHHRLLCIELPDEKRGKLKAFYRFAYRKHENFILGAQVLAEMALLHLHFRVPIADAVGRYHFMSARPEWQDLVEFPIDPTDPERFQKEVKMENFRSLRLDLMQRSLAMLADIFDHLLPDIAELFDPDLWAGLLGQFERSNNTLQIPHPLSWHIAESLQRKPRDDAQVAALLEVIKTVRGIAKDVEAESSEEDPHYPWIASGYPSSSEDDDEDENKERLPGAYGRPAPGGPAKAASLCAAWDLPHVEGVCLLRPVAMMNHSCVPNVDIRFPFGDHRAVGQALQPLDAGAELCMTYVAEHHPLALRRGRLQLDYGFKCVCPRCKREEAIATQS